jgi:chromosome transmission fidelity protein 18
MIILNKGTNRLILTWIKSWDYVVFGKEVDKEKLASRSKDLSASASAQKKRKRMYNQNEAELEEKLIELDEYNRPKIKVALISGPPGLGKTTLAQIIAKRAGYNYIEMNAR